MSAYEYALFVSKGEGQTEIIPILPGENDDVSKQVADLYVRDDSGESQVITTLTYAVKRRVVGAWEEYNG